MIFGVDISHYNGSIDFGRLVAVGVNYCGIKAWENGAPDPMFARNRAGTYGVGLPNWGYAFAHDSDTTAHMDECFKTLDGAVLAVDWEAKNASPSTVERWMGRYEDKVGRQGMNYYGLSPQGGSPTARIGQWVRWFARYNSYAGIAGYDGSPNPDWRNYYAIWQFSETIRLDGFDCDFDGNQLAPAVTLDALAQFLDTGEFPPIVPPDVVDIPCQSDMQRALATAGYSIGPTGVDGIWGKHSADALAAYYVDNPEV